MDYEARIKELEEEIRRTQYNKATQHHIGLLKARIAKLREKAESKRGGSFGKGYAVRKEGDATVAMIGFPSVGKSTLLNALTNAESRVAYYEFTTLRVVPGTLLLNGARIQLLDLPGVIEGASKGRGRGREVFSVLRSADLCLLVVDALNPRLEVLRKELWGAGIRINKEAPNIKLRKKERGGVSVGFTVPCELQPETVKAVLKEFGYFNADIVIRSKASLDDLIDFLEGNKKYMPCVTVLNKADLWRGELPEGVDVVVSAKNGENLEALKELVWERLCLIRVYTKEVGGEADMDEPLILKEGATVRDACLKLHKGFLERFRYARVWGRSVKFDGQKAGLSHSLQDLDLLEIHLR